MEKIKVDDLMLVDIGSSQYDLWVVTGVTVYDSGTHRITCSSCIREEIRDKFLLVSASGIEQPVFKAVGIGWKIYQVSGSLIEFMEDFLLKRVGQVGICDETVNLEELLERIEEKYEREKVVVV